MSTIELDNICRYRTESVSVGPLPYITTESMLPNRAGIAANLSKPASEKARLFHKGDILISNIRPYFKKIWQANYDGCCSPDVLVFEPSHCDAEYLYWLLSDDAFFNYMVSTTKGTKMPRGDKSAIMHYTLEHMDAGKQRAIAGVMNPIRELITTNQRTNDNLEDLGQTLLARYLEACDESVSLGAIMGFGNGFAFKSGTYADNGQYKVLTIKNVQDGSVDCSASNRIDALPVKMKSFCKLQLGDVVLSLTGNVGRVGIVAEENCLLNQRVAVLQPQSAQLLPGLYFFFRQKTFQNEMIGIAKGTAQANLSPVETLRLNIPYNKAAFEELSDSLAPLFDSILANKIETQKLAELRDALLPKLMSGEIDVSKVDITQLNYHLCAD
ncbi:restriction endonuclease subunit S [Atopobium fossor]|uniref:restriction endonuclease subunit S n=1 Tax=Atopobium fossor TaxID=39487 RepID=UPI00042132A5|nr:restriction endonuclease subunit S [Atopobium fossor]